MEQTTLTLLVWVLFIGANYLGKYFGFTQKQVALAFAIIAGVWYTVFNQFVPWAIQTEIILFVSSAVGTGKLIYDMLSKNA